MFTKPLCQICFNPNRRTRFNTKHLTICQWCITEISNTKNSPDSIYNKIYDQTLRRLKAANEKELARLNALRKPAPTTPDFETAKRNAEREVLRGEGIAQYIYRSLIDDKKRQEEITTIANQQHQQSLEIFNISLEAHRASQKEIENQIADLQANQPRIPKVAENDALDFAEQARKPEPTKSKDVRLLRAFFIGLIDGNNSISNRPKTDEYEKLKREVRARDNFRCVCCERGFEQGELHVHHIIPLSHFGTNSAANLATLCHPCHNKQHPEFQVTRSYPMKRRAPRSCFVAVDIETTGFSNQDSIIEIAAARFVGSQITDTFGSLVYSKREIPARVTSLTGITQSMINSAPHPGIVMREFMAFTADDHVVFHNASFDTRFINRYLSYFNIPFTNRVTDTLSLSRKKLPNLPNHRLPTLIEYYGIPVSRSHRAEDDSIATGWLYLALRDTPSLRASKSKKTPPAAKKTKQNAEPERTPDRPADRIDYKSTSEYQGEKTTISCKKCEATLRVPLGKILDIRCPLCHCTFEVETIW